MDYTFGTKRPHTAQHHLLAFSRPMTRNIAVRFPDVQDEAALSFAEFLPATSGAVPILSLSVWAPLNILLFNRMEELSYVEHFVADRDAHDKSVLCRTAVVYVKIASFGSSE